MKCLIRYNEWLKEKNRIPQIGDRIFVARISENELFRAGFIIISELRVVNLSGNVEYVDSPFDGDDIYFEKDGIRYYTIPEYCYVEIEIEDSLLKT